jgi:hypothetical protein
MELDWGRTNRVTYSPELLSGSRTMSPTPIDTDMEIFKYNTDDTQMAWGFAYVGSQGTLHTNGDNPGLTARHDTELAPGRTLDMHFVIGVGLDEYSAAYAMRVLNKRIGRHGLDEVIDEAADDARRRTRTTGDLELDRIMNRNLLFTTYYAWGRAIDTEQFVGMTSRSNRYYVSAAYWDRDALLWSFPALLDSDPARAREALEYALGTQARNAGIHSRFIDGVVLEDGFEPTSWLRQSSRWLPISKRLTTSPCSSGIVRSSPPCSSGCVRSAIPRRDFSRPFRTHRTNMSASRSRSTTTFWRGRLSAIWRPLRHASTRIARRLPSGPRLQN